MTIKDMLGNEYAVECTGCALSRGEINPPGGILKATENFLLHQDPEIPVPGFLIITAREHVQSVIQLDKTARHELIDLVHEAVSAVKESGLTERITIIQEERSKHFHVWLFPYYPWMDQYLVSPVSEYRDTIRALKEQPPTDVTIREVLDTAGILKTNLEETGN